MSEYNHLKHCLFQASAHLNESSTLAMEAYDAASFNEWDLREIEKHIHRAQAYLWAADAAAKGKGTDDK